MIIKNKNFSRGRIVDFNPQSGDVIESCNLSQMYPHTVITDVVGLKFKSCNLVNCDVPEGTVVEGCNITQISRCGNLHADYDCAVDCEHVVSSEQIIVDGVIVETIYDYQDRRVD